MGAMTDERDEIIRELTRHCGDGRLTLDELEERIQEVYAAETDDEARHALRELPVSKPLPPREEPEPERVATGPSWPRLDLPPLPKVDLPKIDVPAPAEHDPEWEKPVGMLFTIGGFILLFNGMFWLALICWFVLPGLVLHSKKSC